MMRIRYLLLSVLMSISLSCQNRPNAELPSSRVVGSFEEKQIRYLSPVDLIVLLHTTFQIKDFTSIDLSCQQLTDTNRPVIGDNSPITGTASSSEPGSGFVYWYSDCLNQYILAQNSQFSVAEILEPNLVSDLHGESGEKADINKINFKSLSLRMQDKVIRSIIHKMIGPAEVIKDLGFCASEDELTSIIDKAVKDQNRNLKDVVGDFMYAIGMRSEFLSY